MVLASKGVTVAARTLEQSIESAKADYEQYLAAGGSHDQGWFEWMSALLRHAGAPSDEINELVTELRSNHDELNLWRRVRPTTVAALERLQKANIQLGVISNSEGSIAQLLETVGLAHFFETIVDSHVEGVDKPDRRIFDIALERLGARAATSLYVGDVHRVDVIGARNAGLRAILIDGYGHHPQYNEAPKIADLQELADAWAKRP